MIIKRLHTESDGQYNPDCGTNPLYYGQWPNCPYPTVDTINVYNHCSEDITVDGWGEIAAGDQLLKAPQLQNPTTNPDTPDRIGYWYTSALESTYSFIELNYKDGGTFGPQKQESPYLFVLSMHM